MLSFADDFTLYCAKKSPHEAGRAVSDTLGNVVDALEMKGQSLFTEKTVGENSCNVYHTSIYNGHSCSDMPWHSDKNCDTSSASWSHRWWSAAAFMERTRKTSVERRSQNWCASQVITSANPNSSPPVFHFSNSTRFWLCRLSVCANHVSPTEEPLATYVEESNSLRCGCHLAIRSWPSASWAPVVQHWTSPAGPDGAKCPLGPPPPPPRHLQETKSHKTVSWNKVKSILFQTISPSHYIWPSLFFKSCSSYLETFLLNLFVRAHLIPPFYLTFSTLSSNHEIFLL